MISPGLVSVSFRNLSVHAVLAHAQAAGLHSIEWGGDVHCPPGDETLAHEVAHATADASLTVAAYGSYYRIGVSEAQGLPFAAVLATAVALGAPAIRVWAGESSSATTSAAQRAAIVADAQRVATLAAPCGVRVISEWHGGTLTDTAASGHDFFRAVNHANFATVWQPGIGLTTEAAVAELTAVLPWVEHLHVFHWRQYERLPLSDGIAAWRRYLALTATTGKVRSAALEFVRDDNPAHLRPDALTLLRLLKEIAP